jgi:hypothetical protein
MTEERITIVSRKKLAKMKDLTDWARLSAMTEEGDRAQRPRGSGGRGYQTRIKG